MLDKGVLQWYNLSILLNALTELLFFPPVKRAAVLVKVRYGKKNQASFLSRAAETTVSCYGVPRYQGERLVRAFMSDRYNNGNQGGTAKIFVPEIALCSLRDFLILF